MSRPIRVTKPWVVRDYIRCSGCRLCEVACTMKHEGRIWPEASRIRVFMLVPGAEVPHLCAQCSEYPCVSSCPADALSVNDDTGAVIVDEEKCTSCGACIKACPGQVPHLHPEKRHALICDLCGGDPECAKICERAGYGALFRGTRTTSINYDLYAIKPEVITKNLVINLYGEKGEELFE
ncbi:MAG: 4Fe-4S dicluster domain-containing protein [Candidatus Bathyarchaeota archaeon]|nr:MAG: 4Fe-4S dicluster domain-containing protein [Candidatus Bathyarchaeota archaeon]